MMYFIMALVAETLKVRIRVSQVINLLICLPRLPWYNVVYNPCYFCLTCLQAQLTYWVIVKLHVT